MEQAASKLRGCIIDPDFLTTGTIWDEEKAFLTRGKFTFKPRTVYSYGHEKSEDFRIIHGQVTF